MFFYLEENFQDRQQWKKAVKKLDQENIIDYIE